MARRDLRPNLRRRTGRSAVHAAGAGLCVGVLGAGVLGAGVPGPAAPAPTPPTDYTKIPADLTAAKAAAAYSGTYANGHYGPLSVTADGSGNLSMALGPQKMSFSLMHYTGDTFRYQTRGENAVGRSGVTFHTGTAGAVTGVTLENLDAEGGLGTFTR